MVGLGFVLLGALCDPWVCGSHQIWKDVTRCLGKCALAGPLLGGWRGTGRQGRRARPPPSAGLVPVLGLFLSEPSLGALGPFRATISPLPSRPLPVPPGGHFRNRALASEPQWRLLAPSLALLCLPPFPPTRTGITEQGARMSLGLAPADASFWEGSRVPVSYNWRLLAGAGRHRAWFCGLDSPHFPAESGALAWQALATRGSARPPRLPTALWAWGCHSLRCRAISAPLVSPELSLLRVKCSLGLAGRAATWSLPALLRPLPPCGHGLVFGLSLRGVLHRHQVAMCCSLPAARSSLSGLHTLPKRPPGQGRGGGRTLPRTRLPSAGV